MLLIFHTILFIDWWQFWKWLNRVCGYDFRWTAAAGRQRVCSRMYPIPPSLPPLFLPLSLPLPVIPTICCLQNKSFIYCHFQDCLYLSSDHYANHSRNRGANYQTIWRKLCFSSFGSTFQTIAIMFLSCGRVLHKHSGAMWLTARFVSLGRARKPAFICQSWSLRSLYVPFGILINSILLFMSSKHLATCIQTLEESWPQLDLLNAWRSFC